MEKQLKELTTPQRMVSSCIGALLTSFFVTPFDVIKTRLQAFSLQQATTNGVRLASQPSSINSVKGEQRGGMHNKLISSYRQSNLSQQPSKTFLTNHYCKYHLYSNGLMDHICVKDKKLRDVGSGCCLSQTNRSPTITSSNGSSSATYHSAYTQKLLADHAHRPPSPPLPSSSTLHFHGGTIDAAIQIVKAEGISALWRGLPPTLVMALPATVLYFTTYDEIKSYLSNHQHFQSNHTTLSTLSPMFAGVTARLIAASAISPLELIRTRIQSSSTVDPRTMTAQLSGILRQEGFLALWRGLGPTLWRDVPFSGMYWMAYERLKIAFYSQDHNTPLENFGFSFLSGALAGTFASLVTTPFDVAKTRVQIDQYTASKILHHETPKKSMATFKMLSQVLKEEGFRSLMTGAVPRCFKVAPACAIMISSYEFCKWYLSKQD